MGHPLGLPVKYAANASVRENGVADHFVTNLDSYGGNSGSAVFNAATRVVSKESWWPATPWTWNGTSTGTATPPRNAPTTAAQERR